MRPQRCSMSLFGHSMYMYMKRGRVELGKGRRSITKRRDKVESIMFMFSVSISRKRRPMAYQTICVNIYNFEWSLPLSSPAQIVYFSMMLRYKCKKESLKPSECLQGSESHGNSSDKSSHGGSSVGNCSSSVCGGSSGCGGSAALSSSSSGT